MKVPSSLKCTMGSPKEGQIIEWIMHTKEQMKEVGIVWATLTYWLQVMHMHQHIVVVDLAMLFVCWLTYHSHMVLLCNKGRIQWQAKCPFNHIRFKKTVVGTGCTTWDFKPSMYLSKAILHLGLIRKFIPQNTITSLRQHLWHFSTRKQISFETCVVWLSSLNEAL